MLRKFVIFLSALILCIHSACAKETALASVPNASVVGSGILTYLIWDIYKATLHAPKGRWSFSHPFALSIEYYKEVKGTDITDRSVEQMRNQNFNDELKLHNWKEKMRAIFPDVKVGTVLWAVYLPGKQTNFYLSNNLIGTIEDDDFGKLFFGIWLDEGTTEPQLRKNLLGLS